VPPKLIHLDELEAVPGPGTLKWLPVRHSLGVRAFGCNAYRADEAGTDVVEPHTEKSHEELYFVASGRATFTIDGQTYNAPAGTYVFLPDPASHRHATADEPGTVVLSFGGPPTFEPSAWEWAFRAGALQKTDPEGAVEILRDGLRLKPDDPILLYGVACVEAIRGRSGEALDSLGRAVELRPEAREWAREDSDFDSLRGDERFSSLLAD
jgi:quercetin dioxygenase-like cupin family protein